MSEVYEYDWSSLPGNTSAPVSTMTMDQYLALPEDVSRRIEVSSGMPIFNESPSEFHVGIQHNLTAALREATRKLGERTNDCYRVRFELDLLLEEMPTFAFRRPDVMVYRCLPSDRRGRWTKPRAADAVIVIEVVSEHSAGEDLVEKRARYAAARIPRYWIVRMVGDDGPVMSIERLRLSADGHYVSEEISLRTGSRFAVETNDPFPITISWESLDDDL